MSRKRWRTTADDFDEERQKAFVLTAVLVWGLFFLFLVVRDPVWRLLHEENLVSPIQRKSVGWTELDEDLIKHLSGLKIKPVAGVEALEEAIVAAIDQRRVREKAAAETLADPGEGTPSTPDPSAPDSGALDPGAPKPVVAPTSLRDIARARAAERLSLPPSAEIRAPELLYPETYFAIVHSDRLIRSVEIHQRLPAAAPIDRAGYAEELLEGWMNRLRFRSTVLQSEHLEVGAGVVRGAQGETLIEVVLVESLLELDQALPALVKAGESLTFSGQKQGEDEVKVYVKKPADPGFVELDGITWTGETFHRQLSWDRPGNYALRVSVGERLSDPRPIFVD